MQIKDKIQKGAHFAKMFRKVVRRDGLLIAVGRVLQTVLIATGQTERKLRKYEEELYATKITDLGKIVFAKAEKEEDKAVVNKSVDVIVCVHNALVDVQKCLDSVLKYSGKTYSLIIVDDGSAEDTRDFLADFAKNNEVKLIRNEQALGYTFSANIGLRNSAGDYVVLLNSDTIVTENWLEKMVRCAESDPKIGLVGPLSNTASWQSVPEISEDGDWAENLLPESISLSQWAKLIEQDSGKIYPKIPFLNGFCLMIKRAAINDLGIFDEEHFGKGFGEENDYCLRARKKGWSLAVADDTYIFHSQSKSYSNEKRKILCEAADKFLAEKHDQSVINEGVAYCRDNKILEGIRARIETMPKRFSLLTQKKFLGKSILFILPVTNAGGGGNIIINEAKSLTKFGIEVSLLNFIENKKQFEKSYPNLNLDVIYVKNELEIAEISQKYDAVIATVNFTVPWLEALSLKSAPILGYYVQDYEPFFYTQGTKAFENAKNSYGLIPRMKIFTKTDWNKQIVEKNHRKKVFLIGPSCDVNLFCPRPRKMHTVDGNVRVVAMVRPISPRRAAKMTMKILKEAKKKFGNKIDVVIFGLEQKELHYSRVEINFKFRNLGLLNSIQVSRLFNESDIFVDFSLFQAMGLTAMEAMSAGLAVIVPKSGGAVSYAKDRINSLVIDTLDKNACIKALFELINNNNLRENISRQALIDMPKYHSDFSAYKMAGILFK